MISHRHPRFARKALFRAGFTLIELLVVISIIAILSSVILASLSTARQKGNYASVQESLTQMRNAYELQYLNTNSYSAVLPSGMGSAATSYAGGFGCFIGGANNNNYCIVSVANGGCSPLFSLVSSQINSICTDILNKIGTSQFVFGVGGSPTVVPSAVDYAFAVQNPSNTSSWFCVRSSGGSLTTTSGYSACVNKANW